MKIYKKKKRWKLLLVLFALLIGGISIFFTNTLMKKLAYEEHKKIQLWAEATQQLINISPDQDVSFLFEVLRNNETIPVILVDMQDNIISYRNIDSIKMQDNNFVQKKIKELKNNSKEHFIIKTEEGEDLNKIYYSDSSLLVQLYYYPYFQLALVFLFILASYFAFSASKRAEQDQVWLGMSKETAHQLGTPISSLMAWTEILKDQVKDSEIINELEKDTKRLEKIALRFSKIGSRAILSKVSLNEILKSTITYMSSRIPSSIKINLINSAQDIDTKIEINQDLFEWVIENLCKNAVDAIGENGEVFISYEETQKNIYIDIRDTGKGIPKSKHKTIFNPGYTTKERGWGLGLSLVKRIIEQYHQGKIFVKNSELGNGTTFRIILKK
ncbi:MAG: HAMP domain-containing histidine kinase [Bacteroidales bacterium]|nr:HAMP domain-containing histidine kinase [Bacteroidales bacterium]MCK9499320.1 HAMP domain-containing histidine kinase [Bacteroidales bacterium]MDY0313819.1 HAMP domain-containing sensor histidine kinase [Bacteroidales bacterium]